VVPVSRVVFERGEKLSEADSSKVTPRLSEPPKLGCAWLKYSSSVAPNKELIPVLPTSLAPNGVEYSWKVVLTAAHARPKRPGDDLGSMVHHVNVATGHEVTEGQETKDAGHR